MMARARLLFLMALGLLVVSAATPAAAHEPYFRDAPSPVCTDAKMLKKIMARFAHQAREVHHREDLHIADIIDIHEHRYRPQDVHKARPIARRYCHGTALLSDGRHRNIWYLIEGGVGFASIGSNVEFCVSGFDRWNVYNAACRILR